MTQMMTESSQLRTIASECSTGLVTLNELGRRYNLRIDKSLFFYVSGKIPGLESGRRDEMSVFDGYRVNGLEGFAHSHWFDE